MTQKRILISGYYGFGNTGDEAILQSILTGIRSKNKEIEFTVISGDAARTMRRHNVHAIPWTNIGETIEAVQQSDMVILGGGGLFQDYHQASTELTLTPQQWGIPYYSGFALLANLANKPFMLYSVGVGPLFAEDGRQMTRMAFEAANKATVRDVESFNLLKSLNINTNNVKVTADPAFLLEADYKEAEKVLASLDRPITDTSNLVGVCVRKWDINVSEKEWQQNLAQALDTFVDRHKCEIVFIPFQNVENTLTNDTASATDVIGYMQHKEHAQIITGDQSVSTLNGLIGKCQIFVGMRLHSLIFSAKETVPPVALVYDGKVSNLMNGLSLGKYAVSLSSITTEQLLDVMEESWKNQAAIRAHLGEIRKKMRQGALENVDIALDLLATSVQFNRPTEELAQTVKDFALKQTRLLSNEMRKNIILKRSVDLLNSEKETTAQQIRYLTSEIALLRMKPANRNFVLAKIALGNALRKFYNGFPEWFKPVIKHFYLVIRHYDLNSKVTKTINQVNLKLDDTQKPAQIPIRVSNDKLVNILTPQFFDMDGGKIFLGGAERYLVELVKMLKEQGYNPQVFQGANNNWEREYEGMHITGLKSSGSETESLQNLFMQKASQGGLNIYLAFFLASMGAPSRSIGISHGVYWDESSFQNPYSLQFSLQSILNSFQNLDKIVSVDTNTINWVRGIRSSLADKFTYIPNFVDRSSFKPLENRPQDGKIRIVYPRRLYKARGFWLVLDVLPEIVQQYPQVEFHFVGQANPGEELEVQKLMITYPRQVYWYDLPFDRMFEAYQKADITLIPTINSEGTSLSCLEAMASRNTIVATNVGGLTDLIIPKFNGLLIEPKAAMLKEALHLLIKDADLREELARNAYETAKVFEIGQWKTKWANLISEFDK